MKYLFVVQGDGRGHMTQALALAAMLRRNGHEVVEVLLGHSISREIPAFFRDKIGAAVSVFETFSFVFDRRGRGVDVWRTAIHNLKPKALQRYRKSLRFIHERAEHSGADAIICFYEILMGFYRSYTGSSIPVYCIAHQFITEHPDFPHAKGFRPAFWGLRFATRITMRGATRTLVLSFYPLPSVERKRLVVVPPLLRSEVLALESSKGDYLLGYMLNPGYEEEVRAWHEVHPEVPLRFFWDKKGVPKVWKVDDTLTLYGIDDEAFLHNMAACRAYVSTAGFESVCEALYLAKPLMLIPAHIEQEVNAADAQAYAACLVSRSFDLSRLLSQADKQTPVAEAFRTWVGEAESRFLSALGLAQAH